MLTATKFSTGIKISVTVVFLLIIVLAGIVLTRMSKPHIAEDIPVNLDTLPNPFTGTEHGALKADIVDIGRTARGAVVKKVTFPGTLRKEHLAPDAVYMIIWPSNAPVGKSLEALFEEANNFIQKKGFGYIYTDNAATEIANEKTSLPFNQKFPHIFFMQPAVLNDAQQLADIRTFENAYHVTFRTAGREPLSDNGVRIAPGRIMAYVVNDDAGINIDLDTVQCSNGFMEGTEQCDDGNMNSNDGCSYSCTIESGYTCTGSPSVCGMGSFSSAASSAPASSVSSSSFSIPSSVGGGTTLCGDNEVGGGEQCDDGNTVNGDGCSALCMAEDGFACRPAGSPVCVRKTCTDSDAGHLYTVKGTVSVVAFELSSVEDACVSVDSAGAYNAVASCTGSNCFMRENYCSANADAANEIISCGGYCSNGACMSCGNGVIQTELGEQCDNGVALNGTEGNDCRSDCKLVIPPAFGNE